MPQHSNPTLSMPLTKRDKDAIWHPFTRLHGAPDNVPIAKGKGVYLYTDEGKKILDAVSSWWVNVHGHSHEYIIEKVHEQMQNLEHVIFAGFTHEPAVRIAERLLSASGNKFDKVFFSDNGSTSTEVALKMAFQYHFNREDTARKRVIALDGAYHGDTFGAMAVGERNKFSKPFSDYLFKVDFIPFPKDESVLVELENQLRNRDVGAFIFEPIIQGAAGMRMYSPELLGKMIALCHRYGTLTIADEVMTGFGRTGTLFACDQLTENPNFMCLSKGITGGFFPMGVTMADATVTEAFKYDNHEKTFFHGHSYTGNATICAAANASLDLFERQETKDAIEMIAEEHTKFVARFEGNKKIKDARSHGTVCALEVDAGNTSYFNAIRDKAYNYFLEQGILLRPLGNVICILPPFCITREQLQEVYDAIEVFIEKEV